LIVHYTTGAPATVPVTYDNSGKLVFDIDQSRIVDFVELVPVSKNVTLKIVGVELNYTETIAPDDALLNFRLTGSDADGDLATADFSVNLMAGTTDNDNLVFGSGNNVISGGDGDDVINAGAGNDILIGGSGNDVLTGGLGADVFKWTLGDQGSTAAPARDVVKDFNVSEKDSLDLRDLLQGENSSNLSAYLKFGTDTATGKLMLSVDHDGGTTFETTQNIVLENFANKAALASALGLGSTATDADILNKMLSDVSLKVDQ
jgi:hypothetical protein